MAEKYGKKPEDSIKSSGPFCLMHSGKAGIFKRVKSTPLIELHSTDCETARILEDNKKERYWKRWGPYLSERQWGTVREDYSADGSCWDYFSHDQARSRTYRWGEDGLLGICDKKCRLCFCIGLWNENDSILKERLFGLTGPQGNHGEDVKECYYYLDSTPTHSYMKGLYKYPQAEYPYSKLESVNRDIGIGGSEYELEDTGVFENNKYWDVFAEYAKDTPDSIFIRITIHNRADTSANIHLIPQLWFRNTWVWGYKHEGASHKPNMKKISDSCIAGEHESTLGKFQLHMEPDSETGNPTLLFTDNETNYERLYNMKSENKFVKDAFHRYVVNGEKAAINPDCNGTKFGAHYKLNIKAHESRSIKLILCTAPDLIDNSEDIFNNKFEETFIQRINEANIFYQRINKEHDPDNPKFNLEDYSVIRQSYAGLLWSKQFYHYGVKEWIEGDPNMPTPDASRRHGRNRDWEHLFNYEIISMPDKWEYPWYASWDLAFHMIPFAKIDPEFAKEQLILFLREWYMHPNGQIPAYEFAFGDVNPPVHAWSCFRVYKMTATRDNRDRKFLARAFQKLILNFNWWVNRKDPSGKSIFSGGFLGLDNIGLFDRSRPLPEGCALEQADGTAWMAFFCVTMLDMALELALYDDTYEDMASKFFEHFIQISDAINTFGNHKGLWDPDHGFYYDQLRYNDNTQHMKIRSIVGIIPIFACLVLDDNYMKILKGFKDRLEWFNKYRPDLSRQIQIIDKHEKEGYHHLLAIPNKAQLASVLRYMLDENEFLSQYGIRSLSKFHEGMPFVMQFSGEDQEVRYLPGESNTLMFGGNSNWRGPIWLCINYLIIESLERYHYFYGDDFKIAFPTGSDNELNLYDVSVELCKRITQLFLPDKNGARACHGKSKLYQNDPFWKDLVLFYEYFHGDTGRGCGASHQTGWTALVSRCFDKIQQQ